MRTNKSILFTLTGVEFFEFRIDMLNLSMSFGTLSIILSLPRVHDHDALSSIHFIKHYFQVLRLRFFFNVFNHSMTSLSIIMTSGIPRYMGLILV
jgi:hypothetical protein